MEKKRSNITEVELVNYLAGELQGIEKARVAQAVSEYPALKKALEHLELIWDESEKLGRRSTANVDEAWDNLKQRITGTQNTQRAFSLQLRTWLKVAALLLLLAGVGGLNYYRTNAHNNRLLSQLSATTVRPPKRSMVTAVAGGKNDTGIALQTQKTHRKTRFAMRSTNVLPAAKNRIEENVRPEKMVCNSTNSPMEICIIQRLLCKDGHTSTIATCRQLEPDESKRLAYDTGDNVTGGCKATVDEITIKKVATGETIVFNAESKPLTAGELFSYISGQKKGDILAGTFDADCLAFDSKSGDFILEHCGPAKEENCY